jgi:hypothetical protein
MATGGSASPKAQIIRQSRRDICQRVEESPRGPFHLILREALSGASSHRFQSKLHFPKAAPRDRRAPLKSAVGRTSSRGELVVKAGSVLCFAYFFIFFENFAAGFPEKDIRGRRLRHKTGLRRFWRWSSRESAWPISKLISAMGGTLGASTKGDATLATFLVVVPAAF